MLFERESQLYEQSNAFPKWAKFVLRLSLVGGLTVVSNSCSRPDAFCEVGGPMEVAEQNLDEYLQNMPEASMPPCSNTVQSSINRQRARGESTYLLPESLHVVRY